MVRFYSQYMFNERHIVDWAFSPALSSHSHGSLRIVIFPTLCKRTSISSSIRIYIWDRPYDCRVYCCLITFCLGATGCAPLQRRKERSTHRAVDDWQNRHDVYMTALKKRENRRRDARASRHVRMKESINLNPTAISSTRQHLHNNCMCPTSCSILCDPAPAVYLHFAHGSTRKRASDFRGHPGRGWHGWHGID